MAPAAPARDPLAPGPLGVHTIQYSAGSVRIDMPGTDVSVPISLDQPLEGAVTYPDGAGPWPLLLFLHGFHPTCILADGTFDLPPPDSPSFQCPDIQGPNGEQIQTRIRNYAGYGYLAGVLASHGYAVVSPSANLINSTQGASPDSGATPRAQIIGATLDLMARWNNGAGPVVDGDPDSSVGTKLTGRLDIDQIGLMGHSRGGEAVTRFLELNVDRQPRYNIDGVVALAPTDSGNQAPGERAPGTNWAVLLPGCDGDVADLEGGNAFERAKVAPLERRFARFQWLVAGANHDWFNTVWYQEDPVWSGEGVAAPLDDSACSPRSPTAVRLQPDAQRRVGLALIAAFMRRYVGGERGFDAVLQDGRLPRGACAAPPAVPCDALVRASYIAPSRRLLIGPGATHPLSRDAVGGALRATGLRLDWCDPDQGAPGGAPTPPGPELRRCPGPHTVIIGGDHVKRLVNRSGTRQLVVDWNRPARLVAELPDAAGNAAGYRTLGFRVAVNVDRRNPEPIANRAAAATQRLDVVLRDRAGHSAAVAAERFSTALEPSLGNRLRQLMLNDVRIPLVRFRGVDLHRLADVELRFGVRGRRTGSIQLADMALQ